MRKFVREIKIDAPADELYAYHFRQGAFLRQAQPWLEVKLLETSGNIADGRLKVSIGQGLFRQVWEAQHQANLPGRQFKYIQIKGPFNFWEHTHSIAPQSDKESLLNDTIIFAKPWYISTNRLLKELDRLFRYRHTVTQHDMQIRQNYLNSEGKSMKILIAGASGLVGTDLIPFLTTQTHTVKTLTRRKDSVDADTIFWDPEQGQVNLADLEGFDAIINLAGDNLASGRWTEAKKEAILQSRLKSTRTLARAIKRLKQPPKVFLNASAIGYYGDCGDRWVDEKSPNGKGFLAEVCRQWEAAAHEAERPETRVVTLRTGVVFSPKGGAFAKMSIPFKLGLGGAIGSGKQWVSWVAIDELLSIIHHILATKAIVGPVDAVSPNPVTNREMTKTLGKVLGRWTIFPMPAAAAKFVFGKEMAEETLLSSTRVRPSVLQETNYQFLFPDLEGALHHMLGTK